MVEVRYLVIWRLSDWAIYGMQLGDIDGAVLSPCGDEMIQRCGGNNRLGLSNAAVWACVAVVLMAVVVLAQTGERAEGNEGAGVTGASGESALAIRQERVRRLMMEIPPRMLDLARSLEATEPERAKRLQEAIAKLQQLRMDERMAEAAKLLAQERLEPAGSRQAQIIGQIEEVIGLLLAEDAYVDPALAEMAQLEAWRKQLEQLIGEQQRVQREVRLQLGKDKALRELAEAVRKVEELIERQKEVQRQTGMARQGGAGGRAGAVEGLAEAQHDLAGETQGVMSDQGRMTGEGQGALQEAMEQQQQAGEQLAGGRGAAAQASQEKAIEALVKAVQAMREERSRVERLPKESFEAQAKQQEALEKQAGELGESMSGQSDEGQGQQGEQMSEQAGKQGAAAMQKAQQAMQRAGRELRKQQGEAATKAQAEAEKELEAARQAVEERLRQLRKQMMEERLAGLEARFRLMLERQKPVTTGTRELAVSKAEDWSRAQLLQCTALARRQMEIHDLAQQCMDVLRDDGTTVVFPQMVEQLQGDLKQAGQWLEAKQADATTTGLQQEIEAMLKELLEAVAAAQKHLDAMNQAGGQGQQEGKGMEALAPPSAELKLLRAAQVRINERTRATAMTGDASMQTARRENETTRLATMQAQLRDWAKKLAEGQ